MVEITCPRCGAISALTAPLRRSADEFCVTCDYPLFWAPGASEAQVADHPPPGSPNSPTTCDRCSNANPPGSFYCNRCSGALDGHDRP